MRLVFERVPMFGVTIIWDRDGQGLLIGIVLPFIMVGIIFES